MFARSSTLRRTTICPQKSGPPKRIGLLSLGDDSAISLPERHQVVALAKKGWIEGRHWLHEPAYAQWKPDRFLAFAQELFRQQVDLIVTGAPAATLGAARATRTLPIVFGGVVVPVEMGPIASSGRPGRNLTGQAIFGCTEVTIQRLEFLAEFAPRRSATDPTHARGPERSVLAAGACFPLDKDQAASFGFIGQSVDAQGMHPQHALDILRRAVSTSNPNHIRPRAGQLAAFLKIGILGHDDKTIVAGETPNRVVICPIQPCLSNVQ